MKKCILLDYGNVVKLIANEVTYDNPERYPCIIIKGNINYFSKELFKPLGENGVYHLEVEVPEGVEPNKYCYTEEKGFYLNPDYVEPKSYSQKEYDAVIMSLIEEGRL